MDPQTVPPVAAAVAAVACFPRVVDPQQFAAHRPALLRFAMAKLRNQAHAEDAVQETLLAALHAYERFSGRSSLRTWLTSILKHKIVDCMRASGREQALDDGEDAGAGEDGEIADAAFAGGSAVAADWADPEHVLARKRFVDTLEGAMASLPKTAARAFLLREVMGLDIAEISRELSISVSHCGVMLHRIRAALRARLESEIREVGIISRAGGAHA